MGEVKTCFHCGTNFERALAIAERRNGDTNDLMDASQEAQHYDWLDQQNEKLKAENTRLREALWALRNDMVNIHNLLLDFYSEESVYPFNPEYAFNHSKQALQKLNDSKALKEQVK